MFRECWDVIRTLPNLHPMAGGSNNVLYHRRFRLFHSGHYDIHSFLAALHGDSIKKPTNSPMIPVMKIVPSQR